MRYKKEPFLNATLGGWSHNPFDDTGYSVDAEATFYARYFINLITQKMIEDYHVHPMTGVEVNFVSHGIEGQKIIDYINNTTESARKKLHTEETQERWSTRVQRRLQRSKKIYRTNPKEDADPELDADRLVQTHKNLENYCRMIDQLKQPGEPNFTAINEFMEHAYALKEELKSAGLIVTPLVHALAEKYCHEAINESVVSFGRGIFSRAYIARHADAQTASGLDSAPEITTFVGSPLKTVDDVNRIKKILLESTYRFHKDPRISKTARQMHEALGDFDISFIDPASYFNLAEQVNFSLQSSVPKGKRRRKDFNDNNLMGLSLFRYAFAEAFARFLPADRILTIGNRYPYDDAKFHDLTTCEVRVDREGRVGSRVEICDFNDATSNLALSMVSILSVAYIAWTALMFSMHKAKLEGRNTHTKAEVLEELSSMLNEVPQPKTPADAIKTFRSGPTVTALRMIIGYDEHMRAKGKLDGDPDQLEQSKAYLEAFIKSVEERHKQRLKLPWGGAARARQESAKGWQVAQQLRRQEATEAEQGNLGPAL